ncbi:related to ATP-dependent RNA helicase ROK1 [Rhynchosporium graminicola]|uniref:ATP-dependent RNA helicase n=1 Tax=Rhynchosporium graminicola TaxID=2792576 RepID=A0A1E1L094_9HELO|nr:related to ATP-dependent RNA helicase ROK1 [Rhynchosporium commune]
MDILKILSRSTKRPNKSSTSSTTPAKLPSAGVSANPQLYHDAIPDSRGKKRKRGAAQVEEQTALKEEDEDVDFFAPKATAPKAKKTRPEEADNATKTQPSTEGKLLDQDECRQILKSHRLKITLLPSGRAAEKKIKKSKSGKENISKKVVKEEIRQLFPQPLMAFGDLKSVYDISGRMAENLVQQGYKIPTEVQMASLPFLLRPDIALGDCDLGEEEVDLLAVAPTGSGKTLAFLIPIVDKIIQRRRGKEEKEKGEHEWEAVVVVPTKELATQIVNEAKILSLGTGVKVVGMRKGMRIVEVGVITNTKADENASSSEEEEEEDEKEKKSTQAQPVSKGDILITTPGLLLSALSTGNPSKHASLPNIRTLVLDEADVLLDPLFKDQTLTIWSSCTSPLLRVTLWSATMGSSIESLAHSTITTRRTDLSLPVTPILRLVVGLKDSAIPNITHYLTYAATEPGKLLALRQLLHPTSSSSSLSKNSTKTVPVLRPPFLVFTQTIPRATALHSELLYDIPSSAGGSSRIAVLHSSLTSTARSAVMSRFRSGEIWVLITTDILSRGIDFRGVNGVVNYDVPNSGASYIHRVGRTGRGGREGGVAVTFYTKEDIPYVRDIANIIAASEKQAGKSSGDSQKWLLDMLPKVGKEDKKKLKLYGVEARRGGLGVKEKEDGKGKGKGKGKMLISTKSGYERKLENNRKGAIQGSRRRAQLEASGDGEEKPGQKVADEGEWGGIDE